MLTGSWQFCSHAKSIRWAADRVPLSATTDLPSDFSSGGAIEAITRILLGLGTGRLVSHIVCFPVQVMAGPVVVAFGFSTAVGIFLGCYPARKAAVLDSLDALRFE